MQRTLLPLAIVVLAACSSSTVTPATTAVPPTSAATSSTAVPSSTISTATVAPSTTSPLDQFELSLGGIGEHHFGDSASSVLPALEQVLGHPDSDDTRAYPNLQPDGTYLTDDASYSFTAPFGQEACWRTGLCVEFGGGSDTQYSFMGWTYMGGSDVAANQFHTRSRITVGMTWAQAPDIRLDPNFCTGWANGTVDGVKVRITANTPPFTASTPHSSATITAMHAGGVPVFNAEDC